MLLQNALQETGVIKIVTATDMVFSHGWEMQISTDVADLIPNSDIPLRHDPSKFQRTDLMKIDDDKVYALIEMAKDYGLNKPNTIMKVLEPKMPYYDGEACVIDLNVETGDGLIYHENSKLWTYKKFSPSDIEYYRNNGGTPYPPYQPPPAGPDRTPP